MFGFLFGAACLGGLVALAFHGPRHGHWHGRRWHRGGFGFGRPFQRGRFLLNSLFDRLDTTPGQEKAILAAISELRESAGDVREKLRSSRTEVAEALREEVFEEDRVRAVVDRHAEELVNLGGAGAQALGKIHEALDSEQRKQLARWIESGHGFTCG